MTQRPRFTTELLAVAAWFGLMTGVVESVTALALRLAGHPMRVSAEILWIAPAVNVVLFVTAGAALALAIRLPPFSRRASLVLVTLLWMLAFAVLQVIDVIAPWSALVLALGVAVAAGRRLPPWDRFVRFVRRTAVPMIAVAAALAALGIVWAPLRERTLRARLTAPPAGAPNVLFVILDTLRADHVSAYGYPRDTTPNLDQLARRGVLFEHAFANSSWTLPSHASLLTGRHPYEHGADWLEPMDSRITTLADTLASRGYLTAAFAANTSYVSPTWGLGRGFSRFDVYGASWMDDAVRTAYGRRIALNLLPRIGYFDIPGRKRADHLNREFLAWTDGAGGRPFFGLLNYLDVHDPYVTVDSYHTRFSQNAARGDVINFQFQPFAFRRKPALSPIEIQAEIDAYDGCLAYLDSEIGRLWAELGRRGLDTNTILVITSDHGESFGNHDLFGHGNSLYLETLRVPLVIVWPDRVPAGRRVGQPVGLERLPATILDLIDDTSQGAPFPGRSLATHWLGPGEPVEAVLSEVSQVPGAPPGYPTGSASLTSIITDYWHLVLPSIGEPELYAWPRDLEERVNLAATAEGRGVVEHLKTMAQQIRAQRMPAP